MRVPFVYKPGIQRDGGDFQDEYCIDGQWIRFVGGKIRKMKGQQELVAPEPLAGITFLDMYFNGTNPILIYATIDGVHRCIINDSLTNISNDTEVLAGLDNNLSRTWQGVKFIKDGRAAYGLLITSNGSNMLSNVNGTLSWRYLDEDAPFEVPQQVEASGGILYSTSVRDKRVV